MITSFRSDDAKIRGALLRRLAARYRNDRSTRIVEELGICRGQVRVDVAVINGSLHGFEIKSHRDDLRRLAAQVDVYGRVFDRATLIVDALHLRKGLEVIPPWWGVVRVETGPSEPRFVTLRPDRRNPNRDARSLVELLWLDDALALLQERDAIRGMRGKPRRVVWDKVCEHFELSEIARAVRDRLKARARRRVHS